MTLQLDLFAAPPSPPVSLVATPQAAALEPDDFAAIPGPPPHGDDDAEEERLGEAWRRGRERVEVDPKRLDKGGDVDRSYCADTLCYGGKLRSTFRLNGADWVNTGGLWWTGGRWCDCYRVVPLEAFDGPSAPYSKWDWDKMREHDLGGYHGMSAKQGSRDVVLVGPPLVVTAGEPEQTLL